MCERYRLARPQRPYHQKTPQGGHPSFLSFSLPSTDHVLRDCAAVELGVAIMVKSGGFDPYHSRVRVTRVLRDRPSPFEVSVDNTLVCAIQLGCMLPCVSCASYGQGQVETAVRWLVDGTKRIMCARSSFRHPSGSTHPPASLIPFRLSGSDALRQRMIRTPYPSSSGCGRLTGCVASSERCSKKRERKQSNTPPLSAASAHRPLTLRHMHPFTDRICPLIRSPPPPPWTIVHRTTACPKHNHSASQRTAPSDTCALGGGERGHCFPNAGRSWRDRDQQQQQ